MFASTPDGSPPLDRRLIWAGLVGATIVAAALRLPFIDHQSLWFDETYTRDVLGEPSLSGVWHHVRATESTPPLYYVIGWLLGGRSAAAMRVIPAIASTVAVPIAFGALRRFIGDRAALAASAMVSVSPILVAYATDARAYGLLVLTSLLSVWALSGVMERPSRRSYTAWAIAAIACVWTHYFGAFLVAGEVIVLLAAPPAPGNSRRLTTAWTAAIGAGLVPLIPLVVHQAGDGRAGWITGRSLYSRIEGTVREFAMGANVPRTWLEALGLAIWSLAVAAGTVFALRPATRTKARRHLLALCAIGLGVPLVLAATGIEDSFDVRNLIAIVPLACGLAAPALLKARTTPLAAYLALAAGTSLWVATDWRYEQTDWRDALAHTQAIDATAPVLAVTPVSTPVVRTYLGRPAAPSQGILSDRIWLVVEPERVSGDRALVPAPAPPAPTGVPGFTPRRTIVDHGFRLVLEAAPAPTRVTAATVPGATVFAAPAAPPRPRPRPPDY